MSRSSRRARGRAHRARATPRDGARRGSAPAARAGARAPGAGAGRERRRALPPAPAPEADRPGPGTQPPSPSPRPEPAPPPMRSFPTPPPADWHPDDEPIGTIGAPQPGAPGMSPHRPVTVPRRRRRPGRWLLLVVPLALLLIVVRYAAGSTSSRPQGRRQRHGRVVRIPQGASTREIGDLLADQRRRRLGRLLRAARRASAATTCAPAATRCAQDMGNAEAIDALTRAARAPKLIRLTLPEGPSRREHAPRVAGGRASRATTCSATQRSPALNPRDYGAPKRRLARGLPVPGDLRAEAGRERALARRAAGRRLQGQPRARSTCRRAKRKNLTRYDVADDRLDDRARDRAAARAPARRRPSSTTGSRPGCRSASTRRRATRRTTGRSR